MQCGKPNQLVATGVKKWTATNKQCTSSRSGDARKHCINFLLGSGFENKNFLSAGSNGRIYFMSFGLTRYRVWVLQESNGLRIWYQLTQQCESFAGDRNVIETHAGHVAARPVKASHQSSSLRILTDYKNNRKCLR